MSNGQIKLRALVIGASGGIGSALVKRLQNDSRYASVIALSRSTEPAINYRDEASIASAAHQLQSLAPFDLIFCATGILYLEQVHSEQVSSTFMPEKKLSQLNYAQLQETFLINTFGPALVLSHFSKLLNPAGAAFALLSAKVGSIEDNRLGGWYSYRASKAALNMLIKTSSIELKRTQPNTVLVALHPGTVNTSLSKPFKGQEIGRPPEDVAADLLQVIAGLTPERSGGFITYAAERLPW